MAARFQSLNDTSEVSGPLLPFVVMTIRQGVGSPPAANAFEAQVPPDYERIKVAAYDTSAEAAPTAGSAAPPQPSASTKP